MRTFRRSVCPLLIVGDLVVDRANELVYLVSYDPTAHDVSLIQSFSLAPGDNFGSLVNTITAWGSNSLLEVSGLAMHVQGRLYVACAPQGVIVIDPSTPDGSYVTNLQGFYDTSAVTSLHSVAVEPATGHVHHRRAAHARGGAAGLHHSALFVLLLLCLFVLCLSFFARLLFFLHWRRRRR